MPLTDADLAAHDALAQALIRHLRRVLQGKRFEEVALKRTAEPRVLVVRIPAASATVGDVLVYSDGGELTTVVGDHTHGHRGAYLYGGPSDPAAIEKAAAAEADWLRDLIEDRVVIWSRRAPNRQVLAGGTEELVGDALSGTPLWLATEAWLWSGHPYPLGRRG